MRSDRFKGALSRKQALGNMGFKPMHMQAMYVQGARYSIEVERVEPAIQHRQMKDAL